MSDKTMVDVKQVMYRCKRSIIGTGIWVDEDDKNATLGKLEIYGLKANEYHEGAELLVTAEVIASPSKMNRNLPDYDTTKPTESEDNQ